VGFSFLRNLALPHSSNSSTARINTYAIDSMPVIAMAQLDSIKTNPRSNAASSGSLVSLPAH
jgi:hypothetical protein